MPRDHLHRLFLKPWHIPFFESVFQCREERKIDLRRMMLVVDHHLLPTERYPILPDRLWSSTAVAEAARAQIVGNTRLESRTWLQRNKRPGPQVFLTLHKRADTTDHPHAGHSYRSRTTGIFLYSETLQGSFHQP